MLGIWEGRTRSFVLMVPSRSESAGSFAEKAGPHLRESSNVFVIVACKGLKQVRKRFQFGTSPNSKYTLLFQS